VQNFLGYAQSCLNFVLEEAGWAKNANSKVLILLRFIIGKKAKSPPPNPRAKAEEN